MDINKNEVGFRISSIRKQLGLNQELFGEKISNAHKSLVSKWEKGQSLPNNERLKIIADLGGISVDELLYGPIRETIRRVYKELREGSYIFDTRPFEHDHRFDMLYNPDNPADSPIFDIPKEDEEEVFRIIEGFVNKGVGTDYSNNKDLIAMDIIIVLTKRYRELNRSNQNTIKIALTELINLKEKILWKYFVDHYSINDNVEDVELVLQSGLDKGLYVEMREIFNKAVVQLSELQERYPDRKE